MSSNEKNRWSPAEMDPRGRVGAYTVPLPDNPGETVKVSRAAFMDRFVREVDTDISLRTTEGYRGLETTLR